MDIDVDRLVETVTKEIIRRMEESERDCVLVTDGCPEDAVSNKYYIVRGNDPGFCKYVLLTEAAYRSLAGSVTAEGTAAKCCEEPTTCCDGSVDLRGKRLLHERDLRDHNVQRDTVVRVSKKTIVTALAHDYAKSLGAKVVREN